MYKKYVPLISICQFCTIFSSFNNVAKNIIVSAKSSKKPDCTKIEEMKQFYQMAWKKYTPPCQQISMVSYLDVDSPTTYYTSRINGTLSNLNDYFYVALDFPKTMFKEIQLIRALDEQSLFGNIGGYVGACLGYSFLQIPGFIHLMYAKYQGCFKKIM